MKAHRLLTYIYNFQQCRFQQHQQAVVIFFYLVPKTSCSWVSNIIIYVTALQSPSKELHPKRGSDSPMLFLSLEYYLSQRNKTKVLSGETSIIVNIGHFRYILYYLVVYYCLMLNVFILNICFLNWCLPFYSALTDSGYIIHICQCVVIIAVWDHIFLSSPIL